MKNEVIGYLKEYKLDKSVNFDEILVLGIDNGDGEYVVAEAECDNEGECDPKERAISSQRYSEYAITYLSDDNKIVEIGSELTRKEDRYIFSNYKKLPEYGEEKANKTQKNSKTYNYVMQMAIGKLIENYIYHNSKKLMKNGAFKKKKIVIFIGRPSSKNWEAQSEEYAKIIRAGIDSMKERMSSKEGFKDIENVNFYVIPVSEARAAMIYEYKTGDNDLEDKYIVIIDGGSSTFDMAVMYNGEVICEYSRQVGAGMLDKNLLHLTLLGDDACGMKVNDREQIADSLEKQDNKKREIKKINSKGYELAHIRSKKEEYFGDEGIYLNKGVKINLSNGQESLVHDIIDKAFNDLPVMVAASYPKNENDVFHCSEDYEYASFRAALEDFFKGAKAKLESLNSKMKIDGIIVTGGATIMPQIDEIMNEIFEIEKNKIKVANDKNAERKFSVAKGCTYLGYIELYKQIIIEKLWNDIVGKIDKEKLKDCIVDSLGDELYESYLKDFKAWIEDDKHPTLRSMKYTEWNAAAPLKRGMEKYLNGFYGIIEKEINDTAKRIVGDTVFVYKPKVSSVIIDPGFVFHGNFQYYLKMKETGLFSKGLNWFLGLENYRDINKTEILTKKQKEEVVDGIENRYRGGVIYSIKDDVRKQMDKYINKTVEMFSENIKEALIDFIEKFEPYMVVGNLEA